MTAGRPEPACMPFLMRGLFGGCGKGLLLLLGFLTGLMLTELSLRGLLAVCGSGAGPETEYRIVCLGDSITTYGGPASWPRQLEAYLKSRRPSVAFRVITRGVESSYLTDRVDGCLRTLRPRLVIAMMGMGTLLPDPRSPVQRLVERSLIWKLFWLVYRRVEEPRITRTPGRETPADGSSPAPRPVPAAVQALLVRAQAYWNRGLPAQSLQTLERAAAECPDDASVLVQLAKAYSMSIRPLDASRAYEKALAAEGEKLETLVGYGWSLLRLGEYGRAETVCQRALKRFPDDGELSYLLISICEKRNRKTKAETLLRAALGRTPENAGKLVSLGSFYLDIGEPGPARAYFEAAIRLEPGRDAGYAGLGAVCHETGDLKAAKTLWAQAVSLNPGNVDCFMRLADLCRETGDFPAALGVLKSAIRRNPGSAPLRVRYWQCLCAAGRAVPDRLLLAPMRVDPNCAQGYLDAGLHYLYDRRDPARAQFLLGRYQKSFPHRAHMEFELAAGPGGGLRTRNAFLASPVLKADYPRLRRLLAGEGVALVCAQYPLQPVALLRGMFDDTRGVVFVDNDGPLREALEKRGYYGLFTDRFGGDFGHATAEGNRLLAETIGKAVLARFFPEDRRP